MIGRSVSNNKIPESLYPALRFAKPRYSCVDPTIRHLSIEYQKNYNRWDDPNLAEPEQKIDLYGLLSVLKSMRKYNGDI